MKALNSIKRIIIISAVIIISFLIQNTISLNTRTICVTPNILLIVTCIFGYMNGKNEGIMVGFFCGLLVDIFFADIIGLNALLYMYIGLFSGFFNRLYFRDMIYLPMTIIGFGDFAFNFGYFVFRFAFRNRLNFFYYFGHIILPEIIFTVFAGVFIYKILYFINDKWLFKEQRSTLNFD